MGQEIRSDAKTKESLSAVHAAPALMSTQSAARSIEDNTRIRGDGRERHDIHHSIKARKIPLRQI